MTCERHVGTKTAQNENHANLRLLPSRSKSLRLVENGKKVNDRSVYSETRLLSPVIQCRGNGELKSEATHSSILGEPRLLRSVSQNTENREFKSSCFHSNGPRETNIPILSKRNLDKELNISKSLKSKSNCNVTFEDNDNRCIVIQMQPRKNNSMVIEEGREKENNNTDIRTSITDYEVRTRLNETSYLRVS